MEASAHHSAIERACSNVGGQSALARLLQCTPQNVQKMCRTGRIPAHHVLKIERVAGVPRHEQRPDLYPLEQSAA
ncbi:transcriptional regulator [Paraburkholderia steynii]|uniref:transcriptional regulator n=1 Tax=Paraburkholderia steynii TaxID=1245441 RepID=UPI000B8914B0|nr:YdaS family helix-turn-helix protein [Paraburkholderia steynii]